LENVLHISILNTNSSGDKLKNLLKQYYIKSLLTNKK
jgi:hypothetical protein